jgi:hypothetical protein
MARKQRLQVRVVACGLDTVVANILPLESPLLHGTRYYKVPCKIHYC